MFIFKSPPKLIRSARPIVRITEAFKAGGTTTTTTADSNPEANALVIDGREATKISDLTWLYNVSKKHCKSAAFRKSDGRVVILRRSPGDDNDVEAASVSEAMVGFAKSLAKENGPRGATVNLICDASAAASSNNADDDPCEAPLEWLLSHNSCYITGQELTVSSAPPSQTAPSSEEVVLVTGAARGIGKSTANFLRDILPEKHHFVLVDHPSATDTLSQVAEDMGDATALPLDVTEETAGEVIASEGAKLGGYGRIIHAAGITRDKTLKKMHRGLEWNPVIDVNLGAIARIDATLLDTPGSLLDSAGGGSSFCFFSSTSGIAGNAGQTNYAASKAGLLGYAKAMGQQHDNHNFHVVSPGFIETEMTQKIPFMIRFVASKINALGQGGTPEDVAAAVSFLSSPEASGLAPGSNLRVCGLFLGGR